MRAVPPCCAAWVTDCLPASRAVGLRRYGGSKLARLAPAAGIAQWQSVVISVAKTLVRSQFPAPKMVVRADENTRMSNARKQYWIEITIMALAILFALVPILWL